MASVREFRRWPFRVPGRDRRKLVCGECYSVVLYYDRWRHARWHLGAEAAPPIRSDPGNGSNRSSCDERRIEWVDIPAAAPRTPSPPLPAKTSLVWSDVGEAQRVCSILIARGIRARVEPGLAAGDVVVAVWLNAEIAERLGVSLLDEEEGLPR